MRKPYLHLAFPFVFFLLYAVSWAQPTIEWQRSLGGNNMDIPYSIRHTTDGGFIVAGQVFSNNGDVSGNHGAYDCWVVKLDSAGAIQWKRSYGGSMFETGYDVIQTFDGGYLVAASASSGNGDVSATHGGDDYWIIKLDDSGNIQWQKPYGGSKYERPYAVIQASDSGYLVAGYSKSNDGDVSGNHGYDEEDGWVIKLDKSGNLVWQKCLGGGFEDWVNDVVHTTDGGIILAGYSCYFTLDPSGNRYDDAMIIKLNGNGEFQWQKYLGGSGDEEIFCINATPDDGYILAGYATSNDGDVAGNHGGKDFWVVKVDSAINIQWQKCLGGAGNEYARTIHPMPDGGYIVSGYTSSNNIDVNGNHGQEDFWIVKLCPSGSLQWQKTLGGSAKDCAYSADTTCDGGYIISGRCESNDGDVMGNHGSSDYWVVKLYAIASSQEEFLTADGISVFPNPAIDHITILADLPVSGDRFTITDMLGQILLSGRLNQGQTQVDISALSGGIYFLKTGHNAKQAVKLIKQ